MMTIDALDSSKALVQAVIQSQDQTLEVNSRKYDS
jgi:hypothetical protein